MFLSMLVAWMIPDVPRSLREQLKKENMMLIEFLLNQDQEDSVTLHSQRRSNSCFHANIDIVVEAPPDEREEKPAEEGDEEGVEMTAGEPDSPGDRDPEVGRSFDDVEEKKEEDDGGVEVEGGERERREGKEEDEKDDDEQEGGEERAEAAPRLEEREVNPVENFTVDLDSFMSGLGLLGEFRTFGFDI